MSVILNIIVIGLVALITYWWSSQGFFSALLHLVAVVAAGALAFAFWEPLAIDVLLYGGTFDGYAMGLSLAGLFAIFLLILRGASDSIVRANIMVPPGPDMALGGVMGLAAGILTIGFTMTALGFVHGPHEFLGYKGFGRQRGQAGVMGTVGPTLWVPVDRWTNGFYEWLSISTMHPDISGNPLKLYNPDLYKQASLLRDNYNEGEGQISMPSDAIDSIELIKADGTNYLILKTKFNSKGMDFGSQLVLASSQVRLVGKSEGKKKPKIVHPASWVQETPIGPGVFAFDDPGNYATSIPGRRDAEFAFIFNAPDSFDPNFVQFRGTRFDLPEALSVPAAMAGGFDVAGQIDSRQLGRPIDDQVDVTERVKGFRPSRNKIPGSMTLADGKFNTGFLRMPRRQQGNTSRTLQVDGIYEKPGTRIVQVEISRDSPAWLGGQIEERTGSDDEISLLDSRGHKFHPIGYYFVFGTEIEMKLDPQYGLKTSPELPQLSTSSGQVLILLFEVTQGVRLTSLRVGHTLVGTMSLDVPAN